MSLDHDAFFIVNRVNLVRHTLKPSIAKQHRQVELLVSMLAGFD